MRKCRVFLGVALSVSLCGTAIAADWPVVSQAEQSLKAPRLDPAADAEILLWDVRLNDATDREAETILEHHLRIKIFTERGREAHSKAELAYTPSRRVRNIEGRTIGPDGTITLLKDQDVFDRDVIRISGLKIRVKSFVLPAAVPGAIIEYRWREVRDNSLAHYLELPLQRDIPAHLIRYHLRPLPLRDLGYQMRTEWFNLTTPPEAIKEENGYTAFVARDMPAVRIERFMPPENAVRAWMLVYYADLADVNKTPEKYWNDFAKKSLGALKAHMRATGDVKQAVQEVRAGKAAPTIESIVAYVRGQVRRSDTDTADLANRRENKVATDALKRGVGTGVDQTLSVAAIAAAAGLDVRLALLPDRSDFLSDPARKQSYFVQHLAMVVRDGEGWRFLDPANEHAKDGHLEWRHEGQYALILDDKNPAMVSVPVTPSEMSTQRRKGTFVLEEDGALAGDVAIEYTGHQATERRERDDDYTPQERDQAFLETLLARVPGAAVSNLTFSDVAASDAPYVVRYHIRIPGYAQRTGSRFFVQPGVFERGAEAMFPDQRRTHRVLLPYAFKDQDEVSITFPAGFDVEEVAAPGPAMLGNGNGFYSATMTVAKDTRVLAYTRSLTVGGVGQVFFGTQEYPALKAFFDGVRRLDGHTVTLRRAAAVP